jgi:hypothetical protein
MLTHPTHKRLIALGMARGFEGQRRSPDIAALSFEERLGLLVDREAAERETRRMTTRLKHAALRHNASIEDADLRTPRGLDRALFQKPVAGDWIDRHEGLLVTGPTGSASPGWPARWATRPAATAAACCTSGCRGCSRRWLSPAATAATAAP